MSDPTRFELGTDGPGTILVGLDGSDPSWRALHYAVGLARRQTSRIVVVYATYVSAAAFAIPAILYNDDDVWGKLGNEVEAIAREHCVDITFTTAEGDPVAVLTAAASEHHADLIIVGASEKAGHRLFGSTAVRTVRSRCCPVTVVP